MGGRPALRFSKMRKYGPLSPRGSTSLPPRRVPQRISQRVNDPARATHSVDHPCVVCLTHNDARSCPSPPKGSDHKNAEKTKTIDAKIPARSWPDRSCGSYAPGALVERHRIRRIFLSRAARPTPDGARPVLVLPHAPRSPSHMRGARSCTRRKRSAIHWALITDRRPTRARRELGRWSCGLPCCVVSVDGVRGEWVDGVASTSSNTTAHEPAHGTSSARSRRCRWEERASSSFTTVTATEASAIERS